MSPKKFTLSVADYVIIGGTLVVSSIIGLIFQIISKKTTTNDDYLLAGKNMPVFPVILSMMATFMSATTLMGIPVDIYLYGTNMAFMNVGFILGPIITAYVFMPIYFASDISTIYEFVEKRFGKILRRILSVAFILQNGLFNSATLYAPALAFSAVTNISLWVSIITIGIVCTFYCTVGGMKAVLWTDSFQSSLMFICLFAIIVKGSIDLNGLGNILHEAYEGGRVLLPRFSVDFTYHYTMINVILQGLIISLSSYGGSQVQVQRMLTLKTLKQSKKAIFWSIPLIVGFHLLCCLAGLVFYVYFRLCDPLSAQNGPIQTADQIMPYFITVAMQDYPALPGLCIAGIFSASLSTISSILNSLAAVTVEDLIRPLWPNITQVVFVTKIISLMYGTICIVFAFLLPSIGNLIKMTVIIYGMFAGPNLGIFILAACTKGTNEKGAILGYLSGLSVAAFLSFFPKKIKSSLLPLSNECLEPDTITNMTLYTNYTTLNYSVLSTQSTIDNPKKHREMEISLSYMWISSIALITCLILGYLGSIIIARIEKKVYVVPDKYLSPARTWFSKKNDFQKRKAKDMSVFAVK